MSLMLIDIVLPNVPAACAGSQVGRTRDADTDRQRSPKPGRVQRLQADGSSRPSNGELYVSAEGVAVCMVQCRQGQVTCYSLIAACSVSERPIVPKSDRQSICVNLRQMHGCCRRFAQQREPQPGRLSANEQQRAAC